MRIKPLLTEKSLESAKDGIYTFWVPTNATKPQIKKYIGGLFEVDVKTVKTINYGSRTRRNVYGRVVGKKAKKKAIVTLADKQKISVFGEEGKAK